MKTENGIMKTENGIMKTENGIMKTEKIHIHGREAPILEAFSKAVSE